MIVVDPLYVGQVQFDMSETGEEKININKYITQLCSVDGIWVCMKTLFVDFFKFNIVT